MIYSYKFKGKDGFLELITDEIIRFLVRDDNLNFIKAHTIRFERHMFSILENLRYYQACKYPKHYCLGLLDS